MEREKIKNLDDRFEKLRDNAFRLLQASQIESLKEIDPEALTNQDLEVFEKFLNQPLEETTEKEVEEYLKNMAGELKNQYGPEYRIEKNPRIDFFAFVKNKIINEKARQILEQEKLKKAA